MQYGIRNTCRPMSMTFPVKIRSLSYCMRCFLNNWSRWHNQFAMLIISISNNLFNLFQLLVSQGKSWQEIITCTCMCVQMQTQFTRVRYIWILVAAGQFAFLHNASVNVTCSFFYLFLNISFNNFHCGWEMSAASEDITEWLLCSLYCNIFSCVILNLIHCIRSCWRKFEISSPCVLKLHV